MSISKDKLLDIIIKIMSDNNLSILRSFNSIERILIRDYKINCHMSSQDNGKYICVYYGNGDGREIYLNLDDTILAFVRKNKLKKII